MCKVLNVRQGGKQPTVDRVYVGRPSKWGNPFAIGRDGPRDEVIAKHRAWIARQPSLMAALHELRGKNLRFFADQAAKKWPLRGSLKSRARCLYREQRFTAKGAEDAPRTGGVSRNENRPCDHWRSDQSSLDRR